MDLPDDLLVLVVEDVPSDQELISDAIRNQLGPTTRVRLVGSVRDGLRLLRREPVDVILLDLNLPDSDGVATVAAFQAAAPTTPLVVLTSSVRPDDVHLAVQIGAEDVIAKGEMTWRTNTLRHTVRAALDRRHQMEGVVLRDPVPERGSSLSIVVVEDDPAAAVLAEEMVGAMATRNGWRLTTGGAGNLIELAALIAGNGPPDIALLDLNLPDSEGLATLARAVEMMPSTSIIVLSGEDRDTQALAALDLGATDVLVKDWTDVRLLERAIMFGQQRRRRQRRVEPRLLRDRLTGLPSRALLSSEIDECMRRLASGESSSVAAVFMGLDEFNVVNEQFGHSTGDHVLRVVAGRLQAAGRAEDTLGRIGADVFVLVVQDTARPELTALVSTLTEAVAAPIAISEDEWVQVRLSSGIKWTTSPLPAGEILDRADRLMYDNRRSRSR